MTMIELRCSRDLALRLGAISPETVEQHKALRDSGQNIMVRDRITSWPMFWRRVEVTAGSSE